ncbi:MAG: hypothetical protein QXG00_01030 [Candidatus Woesearchaeota archaeon]
MDKEIRKLILLGIGIGAYTKEKVETEINKFIKKNKLNVDQGKKLAKEFYAELQKYGKEAEAHISEIEKKLKDKLEHAKKCMKKKIKKRNNKK